MDLDDYKCSACRDFLDDAVEVGCCNELLCEGCAEGVDKCPSCGVDNFGGSPPVANKPIRRIVGKLTIACPNEGCDEAVPVPTRREHATECAFLPLPCSFENCTAVVRQGLMLDHKLGCEHRPHTCECGMQFPYRRLLGHLEALCPVQGIECPGCGEEVPRRRLRLHLSDCRTGTRLCDFAVAGCPYMGQPVQLAAHHEIQREDHGRRALRTLLAELTTAGCATRLQLAALRAACLGWSDTVADVDSLAEVCCLKAHTRSVTALRVINGLVVSCSEARDLLVWQHRRGTWHLQRRIDNLPFICTCVEELLGDLAIAGFEDGSFKLVDLVDEELPLQAVDAHKDTIWAAACARGRYVFTAAADTTIKLWEVAPACEMSAHATSRVSSLGSLPHGHTAPVVSMISFEFGGALCVASGSEDSSLRLFAAQGLESDSKESAPPTLVPVATFDLHTDTVWALEVDTEHGLMFSGGGEGTIGMVPLDECRLDSLGAAGDGEPAAKAIPLTGHSSGVRDLAVRWPHLVSCSWDRSLRVWHVDRQECLRVISDVDHALLVGCGMYMLGAAGRVVSVWGPTRLNVISDKADVVTPEYVAAVEAEETDDEEADYGRTSSGSDHGGDAAGAGGGAGAGAGAGASDDSGRPQNVEAAAAGTDDEDGGGSYASDAFEDDADLEG